MDFLEDRNFVLQHPILLQDESVSPGSVLDRDTDTFSDRETTGLRWEASAMGLASIFLGLGLMGILFSLCTVCLKQRRSKEKIVFKQKEHG